MGIHINIFHLSFFLHSYLLKSRHFYFLLLDGYDAVASLLNRFKLASVDPFPLHIFSPLDDRNEADERRSTWKNKPRRPKMLIASGFESFSKIEENFRPPIWTLISIG